MEVGFGTIYGLLSMQRKLGWLSEQAGSVSSQLFGRGSLSLNCDHLTTTWKGFE